MSELRILPINWLPNATVLSPADPGLHAAALAFTEEQFGERLNLGTYNKVWVAAECEGEVVQKIWGIIAVVYAVDVPVMHTRTPRAGNLYEAKKFIRANDMLVERAKNFLVDNGAKGKVFVHVSQESKDNVMLKRLLERLGAKESNRVAVEVG